MEGITTNDDHFAVPGDSEISDVTSKAAEVVQAFGSPSPSVASKAALAEGTAKQLDFGAAGPAAGSPSTPVAFGTSDNGAGIDYYEFVADTLLWKNKVRSAFYLLLGLLQSVLIRYIVSSQTPIISGVCFLLLINLGVNFLLSLVGRQPASRPTWSNSRITKGVVYLFSEGVNASAAVLDKHLSGVDSVSTLQVAASLWILSLLARAVSALDLLLVLHIAAFTVPVAYKTFQVKIDTACKNAWDTITAKVAKLDRRSKVAAVAVPTILVSLLLSRVDLAIAILIVAIFIRSLMQPNEVAHVSSKVAPITDRMTSVGVQLSNFAGSTAVRFDLTPTPSKKKTI